MPYVGLTKLLQPFQQFQSLSLVKRVATRTADAENNESSSLS